MTIEAVTAPVPASHLVEFNPGPDERAWGHLETPAGRIGVLYQRSPQPHLSLYPPVRVPEAERTPSCRPSWTTPSTEGALNGCASR